MRRRDADRHERVPTTSSDSNGGTVMLAFLVGALTGAAVALLFAPASGEETREYLGSEGARGPGRAREAVEQGREVYQRQRDNITSAVERGREAFQQARTGKENSRRERYGGAVCWASSPLAVAVMAIVQVGAIVAGLRVARRVEQHRERARNRRQAACSPT